MDYTVITEDEANERYDELLDECYPVVKIGSSTFYPSKILSECDPIAYDIGLGEFYDNLVEDNVYVLGYTDDLKPDDEEDEE